MQVIVKNMVCPRCIWAVEKILEEGGMAFEKVTLGAIEFSVSPGEKEIAQLDQALKKLDFEILVDRDQALSQQIKSLLIETFDSEELKGKQSEVLASRLGMNYGQLSKVFSKVNGTTIEQYYTQLRVEKAKELLHYGELTHAEISYELGYSSPSHFSTHFKKATGHSPTEFKSQQHSHQDKSEL